MVKPYESFGPLYVNLGEFGNGCYIWKRRYFFFIGRNVQLVVHILICKDTFRFIPICIVHKSALRVY